MVVEAKTVTLKGSATETVTFTTSEAAAGTYSVDVNGLAGKFVVKAPAVPVPVPAPKPTNWWFIGGIIVAYMALTAGIWWIIRRRRITGA